MGEAVEEDGRVRDGDSVYVGVDRGVVKETRGEKNCD